MKHPVIALAVNRKLVVEIDGKEKEVVLPKGSIGVCFAFEDEKAAKAYYGNEVRVTRINSERPEDLRSRIIAP